MATEAGHSSKDSVEPDQVPRMFVSYMKFCPYTERINVVLCIKDLPSHMCHVTESRGNIGDFLKKNGRKIPFLKCGDNVIYDSLQVIDFIDQQYPEPPLWDGSPAQNMLDKLVIKSFEKVEAAIYKLYMTTREVKKENFEELVACLTPFEVELVKRGSKYFGGDEQSMVDVMIYPWFVFLDSINPYSKGKFIFPFDKFPKLAKWRASFPDRAVHFLGYHLCLAKQIQLMKSEIFCTLYSKNLPKFNF